MEDLRHDRNHEREPVSPTPADDEIVTRVVAGDHSLFELLMRRHNRRVFRTVLAILGSERDVEDVMQQAYVSAFQHLDQFRGDAAFSTWLTRIAANEAIRHRRRIGRASHLVEVDASPSLEPDESRSPEENVMNDELRRTLEAELLSLPDDYRAVIILRDVEGVSTTEASGILNVTEGVVRTRLHRARAMMRDRLSRRAAAGLESAWPFAGARCDRVVAAVMAEISMLTKGERSDE